MHRSDLRQQEQLQHFEAEADEGGGSSDSIQHEAPTYYGTCMDDGWTGPDRPTEQDAQADCDAHNASAHGGDSHAFPVPGDRT